MMPLCGMAIDIARSLSYALQMPWVLSGYASVIGTMVYIWCHCMMLITLQVWSEPTMVDAGAYEFADTAKFLAAGMH